VLKFPSPRVALRRDCGPPLAWGRPRAGVDFAVGNRNFSAWLQAVGLGCGPGGEPEVIWRPVRRCGVSAGWSAVSCRSRWIERRSSWRAPVIGRHVVYRGSPGRAVRGE
jgi:hypothetical protein